MRVMCRSTRSVWSHVRQRSAEVDGLQSARGRPAEDVQHSAGPLRRRRRVVLLIAATAVIAAGGGVAASTLIKSPRQIAAETKPPAPTVLSVPVLRRVITETILAQGVVREPSHITQLPTSADGTGSPSALPVVTRILRRPGSVVQVGDVIAEVAGQPIFAMPGSVPAYRDLVPGDSGTDVAQLQAGLRDVGLSTADDEVGSYGSGTARAVGAFYRGIGYAVPAVTSGPKVDRGPMVPLNDLIFVPQFPAHVLAISNSVGQLVTGSLITLTTGVPIVLGQLDPTQAGLVRVGTRVRISDESGQRSLVGTIERLSHQSRASSSGPYLPMRIIPRRPLQIAEVGQDVALRIVAAHSNGPVLAVPEAAIFAGADGRTFVTKLTATGAQVRVPVKVGVSGDGLVEVDPNQRNSLTVRNRVVTGQNYVGNGFRPSSGQG
jgi:hypothetical protein